MDSDPSKLVIQLDQYRNKGKWESPPSASVAPQEALLEAVSSVTGVGFFFAFNAHGLTRAEADLLKEVKERGRPYVIVHAAGKTELQIYEGITGAMPKNKTTGFRVVEEFLLSTDIVIILHTISQARLKTRSADLTYSLAKILVNESDRMRRVNSNLIFIDYASFLQKCWPEMSSYFLVRWYV